MSMFIGYINTITNEYPLFENDIRAKHGIWTSEFILPDGYSLIHADRKPDPISDEYVVVLDQPIFKNGVWEATWKNVGAPAHYILNQNSKVNNYPVSIFKETIWSGKAVYREAFSVACRTGSSILLDLKNNFPNEDVGVNPLELIGYADPIRPPYTNTSISWYSWSRPPDNVLDEYGVVDRNLYPWYGKKYDLTTKQILLKVTHTNNNGPQPANLPVGKRRGYGKLYHATGVVDSIVDYYVECDADEFMSFTEANKLEFPLDFNEQHYIFGYGVVFDSNTLDIHMVKAYTSRPITKID